MRELKFRAWHKDSYIELNDLRGNKSIDFGPYDLGIITQSIDRKEVVLEQYTGLKDKNGKEIYEGDIIKSSEHIGEVCQQGNGRWVIFCVKDKLHDGDLIVVGELECETYDLALTLGIEYCQVIGNIHENGDLLNVY